MEEQLITFETAKLAKEKGFYLKTHNFFELIGFNEVTNHFDNCFESNVVKYDLPKNFNTRINFLSRPSQYLLQKWLREKHNLNVFIGYRPNVKKWDSHAYDLKLDSKEYVQQRPLKMFVEQKTYDTYEDALEAGLLEGLNKI